MEAWRVPSLYFFKKNLDNVLKIWDTISERMREEL